MIDKKNSPQNIVIIFGLGLGYLETHMFLKLNKIYKRLKIVNYSSVHQPKHTKGCQFVKNNGRMLNIFDEVNIEIRYLIKHSHDSQINL
jgi:hypothetical protein